MNRDKETQIAVVSGKPYEVSGGPFESDNYSIWLHKDSLVRVHKDLLEKLITLPAPEKWFRWAELGEPVRGPAWPYNGKTGELTHPAPTYGSFTNPYNRGDTWIFYQVPLALRYGDEGFEDWVRQFTDPDEPPPGYVLRNWKEIPARAGWIIHHQFIEHWFVPTESKAEEAPEGYAEAYAVPEDWPVEPARIPTPEENPNGLHGRYIISKVSGKPVDPRAEYFVLRLDGHGSDPQHIEACRKAVITYANEIEDHIPGLAHDIKERYGNLVPRNDITPETARWLLKFFPWAEWVVETDDKHCWICGMQPLFKSDFNRWNIFGRNFRIPGLDGYASDWRESLVNLKERAGE